MAARNFDTNTARAVSYFDATTYFYGWKNSASNPDKDFKVTYDNLYTAFRGGFTAGSVVFGGSTGVLSQDNTNLFWDDTLNILRAKNISIGGTASSSYGLYMRTNTVTGNPLLIDDSTAGVFAFIDSTNRYVELGTGGSNTPYRFRFVGNNSTVTTNDDTFASVQALTRGLSDSGSYNEGAGFIAQHGFNVNQQRLRITHHTDYSGVNSYLSRSAHFTLDRNGGSGNYSTNKFIFSCSNFASVPSPSTDVWEFHTYRTNDASISLAQTKRAAFDGNGTLALFNAYTTAPYSAAAPTSTEANSFKMYSADITAGNAAPHFITEGLQVVKLYRETTGIAGAAFVANTSGIANDTATFGGYTVGQIVTALKNFGLLQ